MTGGLTLAEARRQRRQTLQEIAREHRKKEREELARLRAQVRSTIQERKQAMREAVESCRAGRREAKENARQIRNEARDRVRSLIGKAKSAIREGCKARKENVKIPSKEIEGRLRGELATERQHHHELVTAARTPRPAPAPPNPYELRKAARIERMKSRAARLARAAEGAHEAVRVIYDNIPLGQPILVGHHSEKRHRRDIERIRARLDKAGELASEAQAVKRRAEAAEENRAVSSDDPEAIPKLQAKLTKLEHDRARMVAANKAARSPRPREALAALGFSEALIERILTPDEMGQIGFPAYVLRNRASEAARLRHRIEELEARRHRPPPPAVVAEGVRIEEDDNRVRIIFDNKPDAEVRAKLKRAGFRWSPTVGAWQRHASPAAWYEARRIVGGAP